MLWCAALRASSVFRSLATNTLALTLAVAWLGASPAAEAKTKKKDASAQKKGKKSKTSKGSMDDSAGQSDGDLAPGSDDAKSKSPSSTSTTTSSETTSSKKSSDKGKKGAAAAKEEPPPEPEPVVEPEPPKEEAPPAPPPEPEPEGPYIRKNWITFGVQQEVLFYPGESGICASKEGPDQFPGNPQYSCRDASGLYEGAIYPDAGNTVQGGFGFATTRIYIGYDRVLVDRLTIGGRLGYAFGGTPTVVGGGTFNPLHAELRSAYFFGDKPFERNGFRPYASLGVGIGEVDGRVSVDFFVDEDGYQEGDSGHLDAWRQTGIAFGALGFGVGYPIGPLMPTLEMRGVFMFGEPAFALAFAGNIAYGI